MKAHWASLLKLVFFLAPLGLHGQSEHGVASFFLVGQGQLPAAQPAVAPTQPFSDRVTVVGTDLHYRSHRWLFGLTFSTTIPQQRTVPQTGDRLTHSISNTQAWMGWVVSRRKGLRIYPRIGPGITSFSHLYEPASGRASLQYISEFSTDFGLSLDWMPVEKNLTESIRGGPSLGLRLGYRLGSSKATWRSDGPSNGINVPYLPVPHHGFYVTLAVGGGYFRP